MKNVVSINVVAWLFVTGVIVVISRILLTLLGGVAIP